MDVFLSLAFIFILGCLLGWVIELFFRRIVHKKWINPGFLKGPYLPLYGFGLTILYCIGMIPFENVISEQWAIILIKILLVGVMMTVIELIAGLIFIKGMNIKLWDYSQRWGNFKGIICPLFSFLWTLIGALYVLLIHPGIAEAVRWFTNNIYFSFFVGIVFGLLIFDFATTMHLALKIKKYAQDHGIIVRYENLKETVLDRRKQFQEKVHFATPLKHLKKMFKDLDELQDKFAEKKKTKEKKQNL